MTGLKVVSLLAGLNGALVQIVMASRVAYGLASRGHAPAWLATVHPKTRTPVLATAFMTLLVLVLAVFFGLTALAKTTSAVILLVYAAVNASLWLVKGRDGAPPPHVWSFPRWISLVGTLSCLAILVFQGWLLLSRW